MKWTRATGSPDSTRWPRWTSVSKRPDSGAIRKLGSSVAIRKVGGESAPRPRPRARRRAGARSRGRSPESVDLRGDVPAAAELCADHVLTLALGLADEQAGAADVHVDAAPVGVPRDHPVDHRPPLDRVLDPVHLRPGQVEPADPAAVDVDDDVREREELGREEVGELLVLRPDRVAGKRAVEVDPRRPESACTRARPPARRTGPRSRGR